MNEYEILWSIYFCCIKCSKIIQLTSVVSNNAVDIKTREALYNTIKKTSSVVLKIMNMGSGGGWVVYLKVYNEAWLSCLKADILWFEVHYRDWKSSPNHLMKTWFFGSSKFKAKAIESRTLFPKNPTLNRVNSCPGSPWGHGSFRFLKNTFVKKSSQNKYDSLEVTGRLTSVLYKWLLWHEWTEIR